VPELPEAETIVRGLRTPLVGRRVSDVEVLRSDLLVTPADELRDRMTGARFTRVRRRGKNLVLDLDSGESIESHLVVNLGMSGRLLHRPLDDQTPPPTHPGVRWTLDDGSLLIYHDVRRFGRLDLKSPAALRKWHRGLGPEPLSRAFTCERFLESLATSTSPVRTWLLDQRRVAGVGNIYANEALFLAGIHPETPARQVPRERARQLHRSLRSVLREAIRNRGTTLRDYRTAQGWEGSHAGRLRVYGRNGLPCFRCNTMIERIVFGGRSAFLCPRCQS
jgi:formamidopyrimidine-DNA glycosylase